MVGVRQGILRAAESIFTRRDFHEVLMEDVAQECGVGKGTLYRYFPSKRDLYLAVMFEGMEALCADLRAAVGGPGAPAEKIECVVRCILGHFWDRRLFFALIHSNEHKPDESEGREWQRRRDEIIAITQDALEEASTAGCVRCLDPYIAAQMLLGMVRGVNRYRQPQHTLDDLVAAVVSVFWHGVAVETAGGGEDEGGKRRG
jgi:AcrR family transcriptional regulator